MNDLYFYDLLAVHKIYQKIYLRFTVVDTILKLIANEVRVPQYITKR